MGPGLHRDDGGELDERFHPRWTCFVTFVCFVVNHQAHKTHEVRRVLSARVSRAFQSGRDARARAFVSTFCQ